jgi:hypothetical protein
MASVENVALDNYTGATLRRRRTNGRAKIEPKNLALMNLSHQLSLMVDRNLVLIAFRMCASSGSGTA